jgi:hypothetical protein
MMVQKSIRPDGKAARGGLFGSGLTSMDLVVVLAASFTFLTALTVHNAHGGRKSAPVELIAQDLGVTPEQFVAAANKVPPPFHGQPPTEAHKKQLATALNVSVERLDTVMEKYALPQRVRL